MSGLTEQLATALERIEDFQSVQAGSTKDELQAAVLCLQEAAGVDEASRAALRQGLEKLGMMDKAGSIFLGLLVGLLTAQEGS